MSPRHVRQGLLIATGLYLLGSPALAQRRGPLHVLPLRAPDGDDETAALVTSNLRQLSQQAGYAVADNSPSLDVEMASFGNTCDATLGPECMTQIAGSLHVPHVIYGSVQRVGRGRNAAVNIEVNLWDQDDHRVVHHEYRTVPGPQARDPNAVRELTHTLFDAVILGEPAVYVPASVRAARAAAAVQSRTVVVQVPVTNVVRGHTLRYVGYGAIGVGAVLAAVSIVEMFVSNGQATSAANADPRGTDDYAAWARYDNAINGNRALSVSDVCARAGNDSLDPSAIGARNVCSANATSRALAIGMGIGGLVIAGAGVVAVMMDRGTNAPVGQTPNLPAPRHSALDLQFSPMMGPHTGGLNLGLTF